MPLPTLEVKNLVIARDDWRGEFTFAVAPQEWVSLIGASGAGKTSLLKSLLGVLPVQSGEIMLDGIPAINLAPSKRDISMVFQHSILLSHLPIGKSLLLALHELKISKRDKLEKIAEYFALLDLDLSFLSRYPEQISGGELARGNLCCALLREKKILLLDEPFSALNADLRQQIIESIKKLQAHKNLTVIAATHQVDEALRISSQVLMVKNGKI
jgi:ABC-type Fe3+/spermidine/putrescine transport system ATPase subunit